MCLFCNSVFGKAFFALWVGFLLMSLPVISLSGFLPSGIRKPRTHRERSVISGALPLCPSALGLCWYFIYLLGGGKSISSHAQSFLLALSSRITPGRPGGTWQCQRWVIASVLFCYFILVLKVSHALSPYLIHTFSSSFSFSVHITMENEVYKHNSNKQPELLSWLACTPMLRHCVLGTFHGIRVRITVPLLLRHLAGVSHKYLWVRCFLNMVGHGQGEVAKELGLHMRSSGHMLFMFPPLNSISKPPGIPELQTKASFPSLPIVTLTVSAQSLWYVVVCCFGGMFQTLSSLPKTWLYGVNLETGQLAVIKPISGSGMALARKQWFCLNKGCLLPGSANETQHIVSTATLSGHSQNILLDPPNLSDINPCCPPGLGQLWCREFYSWFTWQQ